MKSILTKQDGLLGEARCLAADNTELWVGYCSPTQTVRKEDPLGVTRFSIDGDLIAHYTEIDGLV